MRWGVWLVPMKNYGLPSAFICDRWFQNASHLLLHQWMDILDQPYGGGCDFNTMCFGRREHDCISVNRALNPKVLLQVTENTVSGVLNLCGKVTEQWWEQPLWRKNKKKRHSGGSWATAVCLYQVWGASTRYTDDMVELGKPDLNWPSLILILLTKHGFNLTVVFRVPAPRCSWKVHSTAASLV